MSEPWVLIFGKEVRPLSYEEKQRVERDICLLYHQLAEYEGIMGDLYYGSVYALPYWDYVELSGLMPKEAEFIRDGCLVMMLAMAWEVLDGAGGYLLGEGLRHSLDAVRRLEGLESTYDNPNTPRLVTAVRCALHRVEESAAETEELVREANWVHHEYVMGYFRRRLGRDR